MKWGLIFIVILLLGIIATIGFILSQKQPPIKTECQNLVENFDRLTDSGCFKIADANKLNSVAGATLINISEPVFAGVYNGNKDYYYELTFNGAEKQESFWLFYNKDNSSGNLPYKIGQFYKFDFRTVCGPVYSMGPHGGGWSFIDNNFTALIPTSCE